MEAIVFDRLNATAEGQALIELESLCGGRAALARAAGVNRPTMHNWFSRGRVSQRWARKIGELQFFQANGWSKEKIRPDLKPFQWKEASEE